MIKQLRSLMIGWNNNFPLDRRFRAKREILFNSDEHRATNQVDIYLQWLEDELYKEYLTRAKEEVEDKVLYDKGQWVKEVASSDQETLDLFDKIDIDAINEQKGPIGFA